MTIGRRVAYAVWSVFYVLSAGYFFAAILTVIQNGGPVKSITDVPFFRATYVVIALLIISLQLLRIEEVPLHHLIRSIENILHRLLQRDGFLNLLARHRQKRSRFDG